MITAADFRHIRALLGQQAEDDVTWAGRCTMPDSPEAFAAEAIFVICNSGMKNTVAAMIFKRVCDALWKHAPVLDVFKHRGKAAAIESIWAHRFELHAELIHRATKGADELLAFCESLPWIGGITKYHLAKNFGANVAKPDVHLQRLADREGCTPQQLCERLSADVGLCVNAVDTVLWRACANGVINSRTGEMQL